VWKGGKMSRIHKALEKAEREREAKKGFSFLHDEIEKERDVESYEFKPDLPKDEWISDPSLATFFQPGSLVAEQFRKLRTNLFRMGIPEPPRTIMVSSSTSREGKTFVAINLAIGIARHFHTHALLIDCDMRSPQLAKCFGLQNGKGLSDYLVEDRKLPDLLLKTEIEKLSVLPGGTIPDNPTELVGSKKMEALVHELKSSYQDRFIIFDSTPLLATAEPEVLAKLVDGIIIVVKAGLTPRETIKQAIASLEQEKIIGFVLNNVQFKYSGLFSRYFGSDGYYYRYGYGRKSSNHHSRWKKIFPFNRKNS
jgi:protein-tyrosine kinase